MNIENLFIIANAAKNIQAYDIANQAFAVIAHQAITNQGYGMTIDPNEQSYKVAFLYESDSDDLIGSLSDQDGAGYYDLPKLTMHGRRCSYQLCIPLPLVSRWYCNWMLRLIARDYHNSTSYVERGEHDRNFWRLGHNQEKADACYRDLWRRFRAEVDQEQIDLACSLVLRQREVVEEYAPVTNEEVRYLGPDTLAKLLANHESHEDEYEVYSE